LFVKVLGVYGKPFVDLTLLEGAKCGAVRVPMGPAPMPSANNLVWYTSSLNLMFRKAPDPTFRTVFLPPDEYIPQGEMVAIPDLNSCQLRAYGAGPAVWCQTYWRGYRGWTNVLFVHGNNVQLACYIEPNANGCRR
jgi:hypothetical protein